MRHFEDFEIEHMLNSTGGFWLRWRCRRHLKHCESCRARLTRLLEDRNFSQRLREQLDRFSAASDENAADAEQQHPGSPR